MRNLFVLLAITALMIGCNSENGSHSSDAKKVKFVSINDVIDIPSELSDETIAVTGMVTHVCKHGGQKMFITDDTQEKVVLVRVSESIPEFDVALEGSKVEITGKLVADITPATTESEEAHEGDQQMETGSEPENCPTEDAMKDKEGVTKAENVTYYLRASAFKEITEDV